MARLSTSGHLHAGFSIIVVYTYPDNAGSEVHGPFGNEEKANAWITNRMRQKWTGAFLITDIEEPPKGLGKTGCVECRMCECHGKSRRTA